jgi:hypothetical protein
MEKWGNGKGNKLYEAQLPPDLSKPNPQTSAEEREKFITDKYQRKKFFAVKKKGRAEQLASIDEELPLIDPEMMAVIQTPKREYERTALEKLVLEKYEAREKEIEDEKIRQREAPALKLRFAEIKKQEQQLRALLAMRSILDKKKAEERERSSMLQEERMRVQREREAAQAAKDEIRKEADKRRTLLKMDAAVKKREKEERERRERNRINTNPYSRLRESL